MVKRSRREFLRDASFGCLSLSVTPYLIGVNSEVASENIGNFNKHSFLNPNLIGWNDIGSNFREFEWQILLKVIYHETS